MTSSTESNQRTGGLGPVIKPDPTTTKPDDEGHTWTRLKPGLWINEKGQRRTQPTMD